MIDGFGGLEHSALENMRDESIGSLYGFLDHILRLGIYFCILRLKGQLFCHTLGGY